MMKTCKESSLAKGLCIWGAGLVASVVLATNANAFFGSDNTNNYNNIASEWATEQSQKTHSNGSGDMRSKFKMSVEAEGEATARHLGDMVTNGTLYQDSDGVWKYKSYDGRYRSF